MKQHNCNNKRRTKNTTNTCETVNAVCPCSDENTSSINSSANAQQCENQIKICGRVRYRGQGVHLATVVITRNRQVIAECLTDCEGYYEFIGQRANYSLRAHKNNRRSRSRSVSCGSGEKFEVNFMLM